MPARRVVVAPIPTLEPAASLLLFVVILCAVFDLFANSMTGDGLLAKFTQKVAYASSPVRHLAFDLFWDNVDNATALIVGSA